MHDQRYIFKINLFIIFMLNKNEIIRLLKEKFIQGNN